MNPVYLVSPGVGPGWGLTLAIVSLGGKVPRAEIELPVGYDYSLDLLGFNICSKSCSAYLVV
jgi:hypothetical protein